jgi:vacuolar-type H+-ATPase subunit D/Vma8
VQVRDEAAAAERGARRLEQQRLSLQAQLQSLQAEADEAREREDERNLQVTKPL